MALDGRGPVTSGSTPAAAWESFAAAIAARDADAARRAATDGAWRRHGDSAALVYQTATEEGLRLSASGPAWIEGDRAVLQVAIERPGRSAPLYVLLEQRDGSWTVSAGMRDDRHASLFLAGVLPAVFEVRDLGPSPEGDQWARARSEELRASAAEGSQVEILGVHALPPRNRVVVGLRRPESGRSVEEWVCLDTGDGAPREIGRSSYPSLGLLLTGISATLPAREDPVSGVTDKAPDNEGWQVINALLQGLTEIARTTPPLADETGRAPQALGEAIARALETAGQHREAAALRQSVAAQPAGASIGDNAPHTGSEIQPRDALEPVRQELQREIDAFRKEKGIAADAALLDPSFLAEHGQELSARLLRVLANARPLLRMMVGDVPASEDAASTDRSPPTDQQGAAASRNRD
jgi:hypothetical protein